MAAPKPHRVYVLTLRVPEGEPPAIILLRHALKVLLRAFGIRCVGIREADADPLPAADETE